MSDVLIDAVPLLGRALVHFVWQGVVIGAVAALAFATMQRSRPQARYLVGCLAMLACVIAPIATMVRLSDIAPIGGMITTRVGLQDAVFVGTSAKSSFDAWMPWLVAIWAGGAAVFGVRMIAGLAWVERLRRHAQPDDHGAWQHRIDALAQRMHLPRGVTLRCVDDLASPVTAGWWMPVVLMPAALATRMPVALVEALLAHELAHIRRHDYLVNLLQSLVEALLFYHPVVWWMSRRVRAERELVADALAADAIGEPRRLAVALSELSELNAAPLPRTAIAARGGELMPRIQNLLRPATSAAGGRLAVPVIALVGLGLAVYAQATVAPQSTTTSTSAAATPVTTTAARPLPTPVVSGRAVLSAASEAQVAADAASASIARDPSPGRVQASRPAKERDVERAVEQAMDAQDAAIDAATVARATLRDGAINVDDDAMTFERYGQRYRVTDRAMVARVNAAWRDTHALGEQMNALGKRMNVHGENMNRIGQAMNDAANNPERSKAMADAELRLNKAANEYGRIAAQAALAEQDSALAQRMKALQSEMDRQSAIISEQAKLVAAPMADYQRRMEEASKPMRELETQMHGLEDRMRVTSGIAQRETEKLIEESIERGLAQPLETR
ncbi:M56 family metallopeptidase [Cognatilysobacter terrigena]|uniref:M56 family metallopeptidase n=1 Tax=Cognatilysobacter terrigena TaxID=2488749 RepID=UPI001414FCD6|nr:M56 family metallopeptidase [Lysobacter terrigena]